MIYVAEILKFLTQINYIGKQLILKVKNMNIFFILDFKGNVVNRT